MPGYMTEKKAKEILDFLAKNAGFDEIAIKIKHPSKQYIIGCKRHYDNGIIFYLLYAVSTNKSIDVLSIRSMSYKEALKTLLKKSREDAKYIWCCSSDRLFLSRHASLEEILIEMDLSN